VIVEQYVVKQKSVVFHLWFSCT